MRIPQFLLSVLAATVTFNVTQAASADINDDFELRQLTDDTFRKETASGIWLVEHYSPKCSHCRAFAPTWTQMAKDKQHLERLSGFHMGQVNCLAQGDLCNSNGIKFYPQLMLYVDGEAKPHYTGDRSYADLEKFINEKTAEYTQSHDNAGADGGEGSVGDRPNMDGQVVEIDQAQFETYKEKGPAMVEFFAPWCGHCKKLRPTYEKLAQEMKGKLNVLAVDCDQHNSFCRSVGIAGYPTIRMYHHDTKTDYTGSRTFDKLKVFADKAVTVNTLEPIKHTDFDNIVKTNEAFFLYLQNYDTTVADVKSVKAALEPLLGSVPAFTSSDVSLYQQLSVSNPPPTSILFAFSSYCAKPIGSLSFPASEDSLKRFIQTHKFPTLVELTGSNHNAIMTSDTRAVVVLGALHKGDEGKKEKDKLAEVAKAWKRGGRSFSQPVWFVWVDGEKWSGWLKQQYGIKKSQLPSVVVIDTPLNEYYDTTIEGTQVSFDGTSIFSVLEGVYQHFLRPKRIESTLAWGSRSAAATLLNLGQVSVDHPLLALVLLVGAVGLFVGLLQKCNGRDVKDNGTPFGGPRLD
ncbi:protein disulfide-isomerase domain [Kwoniella dendrophila CBS 6074]|uniref:Protein disulfide-isomerase domain n=1 Tax=Kwoniella dendrophila CBS 6074 TaxID=1295534 RepID=A0AAX4JT11_9TREE